MEHRHHQIITVGVPFKPSMTWSASLGPPFSPGTRRMKEITLYTKEQCEERGLVLDTAHQWWNGNGVLADAKIVPGQAASWVSFETIDGHSGTGWVLPSDEGANILNITNAINVTGGNLAYRSWDALKSTSNMIQVFAGQGHMYISFIADDGLAGLFAGAGAGEVTFQATGVFNWK
ncbi:hypothetical protein EW146_g8335 [Bondarzewia mesenterica]|uniref:Uncharacterized protein n=1 Tax=Bondarzewia mesenterica TaxID=1095465 RepID=A0A4S4LFW7_9AGAM|nr:hypothetical protein EW146_g8335 [Bondarzewia mesenterica]